LHNWTSLVFVLALITSVSANNTEDINQYESDIQKKRALIQAVEEKMADSRMHESEVDRELRILETDISAVSKKINRSESRLKLLRQQERDLTDQTTLIESKLELQKARLARYMRLSYYLGERDIVKRIFNLSERRRVEQNLDILKYIRYKRAEELASYRETLEDLGGNRQQIAGIKRSIQETLEDLTHKKQKLAQDAASRQKVLAIIRKKLKSQKTLVERNRREVKELGDVVAKLKVAVGSLPIEGRKKVKFASLKKRLKSPVKSKKFSKVKGLKGVLFNAAPGENVKAVASGRVIFAEWIRGYGMMQIIEHGDGYMTVYGRNEVLFREVGEWVQGGDVIALSGSTGAVNDSGLYFEIRKDGKPLAVQGWF
jgi:murein hydrolase activator